MTGVPGSEGPDAGDEQHSARAEFRAQMHQARVDLERQLETSRAQFDQAQERWSMWALKAYALPDLYWNGMLRGRA